MTNSIIPNWDAIEGNWKQLKGDAKQQWSKLTDEDVELVKGKYVELLDLLQKRYGHAKIQAEREISDWAKRLKSRDIGTEVTALRDEVAKLSASVSQLVGRQATEAGKQVRGAVDDARERIGNSASDAQAYIHTATAELEASIERNPLAAVLVVMIAGLMLGILGMLGREKK
jgi:uncharacterized protein YjbJ (UPF0337 family)/ElaB/YqjD/DUF883 family membrane-anchored ribosome-binding protein